MISKFYFNASSPWEGIYLLSNFILEIQFLHCGHPNGKASKLASPCKEQVTGRDLAYIKGWTRSRSRVQLYICVTMGRNSSIFLLFLVLFGLSSVNGYKLIDDNLEEGEDQNWNQGIGKSH